MNPPSDSTFSRREFLKNTGRFAAVSALAGVTLPRVHGQDKPADFEGIQLALIGCGGRGTGAVQNALSVSGPPLKLVSMADISESKLKASHHSLQNAFADAVAVPEDHRYIGFD